MKDMQKLKVMDIVEINPFLRHFVLGPSQEGQTLATFVPGQFISLAYEIDGSTTTRPYSLTSTPKDAREGHYDVYIGKCGFTSDWLFANVKIGDTIYGSVPFGHFTYEPNSGTKQIIGIAGGFSVTPLHSIAKAIVEGEIDGEMVLFSGWDHKDDIMLADDYAQYAKLTDKFKYVFIVADEEEAKTVENAEGGYVSLDLIKKYASHFDLDNAFYLTCGPYEMYQALDKELKDINYLPERYKTEIPGEIKYPSQDLPDQQSYNQVYTIKVYKGNCQGGEEIEIPAKASETIEVALERAGLTYKARCRSGVCGACRSIVEEGFITVPKRWDTRSEEDKANGVIHPCCSFPQSDIKLIMRG